MTRFQGTSDGREVKHRSITENGSDSDEEITYYIRSLVIGGEKVTEANVTGRSYRTTSPITIGGVQRTLTIEQGFDGDNQRVKQYQNNGSVTTNKYFVKSTLIGVVYEVTNVSGSWIKSSGFVYLNGAILAYQKQDSAGTKTVNYNYQNPVTKSQRGIGAGTEPDPLGTNAGLTAPPPPPDESGGGDYVSDIVIPRHADALNLATGCQIDGFPASCDSAGAVDDLMQMYTPEAFADKAPKQPESPLVDPPMPPQPNPFGEPNSPATAFASGFSAVGARFHSDTPEDDGEPIRIEIRVPKLKLSFSSFMKGLAKDTNYSKIFNKIFENLKQRLNDPKFAACLTLFKNIDPKDFLINGNYAIGDKTAENKDFKGEGVAVVTTSDVDSKGNRLASGTIIFNQNSFFFSGVRQGKLLNEFFTSEVRQRAGLGNLTVGQIKQLIFIHELIHIDDKDGRYDDNGVENPALNTLIREKCF